MARRLDATVWQRRLDELARRHDVPGASLAVLAAGNLTTLVTGYVLLGRVIEQLTGAVWDAAIAEHLVGPLGLTHTWTLPEDLRRFRVAMGHFTPSSGGPPRPAPVWYLMRSMGPAGLVCATAADVVAFARMHLDHGRPADGASVLGAATVAQMQRPQARMPHPHGMCDHWGLCWALFDWDGRRVFGHDGDSIGQQASVRVVPDAGVVVALLTNSDRAGALHRELTTELLADLCELAVPAPPRPPDNPPPVDLTRHVGVCERVGLRAEVAVRDGGLVMHVARAGDMAGLEPPYEVRLVPLTDDLLLGRAPGSTRWLSYFFYTLPDGTTYLHDGARATPCVT